MKIGIITAMSSEQKQVEQLLANKKEYVEGPFQYTEGTIQNNTVILMKCGIGKVNAAAGTVELIRNFHPDCIISTGVAGGIDSGLKVMDVVAGSQIVYHDVWCGEGNAYGQIQRTACPVRRQRHIVQLRHVIGHRNSHPRRTHL